MLKKFLLSIMIFVSSIFIFSDEIYNTYINRFLDLYNEIHNTENGYFSPYGAPYHTPETILIEAPDYGHESTSETYSYYIWLEAYYGRITKDWDPLKTAWDRLETQVVPSNTEQPFATGQISSVGKYAPEENDPLLYPTLLSTVTVNLGAVDPLYSELYNAYNDYYVYGMHWLMDTDNFYGFGRNQDLKKKLSLINTCKRGPGEAVFNAIPNPTWTYKDSTNNYPFGSANTAFLDLFLINPYGYNPEYSYAAATDADARVVQAMYWAYSYAQEQGVDLNSIKSVKGGGLLENAAKMGDYLRYGMFDKHFKTIGSKLNDPGPNAANIYNSCHYLLAWNYCWGANIVGQYPWKIGSSHIHAGYQNPLAAWTLSNVADLNPKSVNGATDWKNSLTRQLEFIRWLQTKEGAIAGGATNNWNGKYEEYPSGTSTFYDLAYQSSPVYTGSNGWFGWQTWLMERTAEYYYLTGDYRARVILDKWIGWVKPNIILKSDGTYEIPGSLSWQGQPDTWDPSGVNNWNPLTSSYNTGLSVVINGNSQDPGITASLARTLMYYAKAVGDDESRNYAKELLDRMWDKFRDNLGISVPQKCNYKDFFTADTFIPEYHPGTTVKWEGKMPNGDVLEKGKKFIDIRSNYKKDPKYPDLYNAYYDEYGAERTIPVDPTYYYHRFFSQAELSMAYADYAYFFGDATVVSPIANSSDVNRIYYNPVFFEAENFNVGFGAVISTDASASGNNKINIDTGCWAEYNITNQDEGFYKVELNVNTGTISGIKMKIKTDNTVLAEIALPNTNNAWVIVPITIFFKRSLDMIGYKIRLYSNSPVSIDYINIVPPDKGISIPGIIEAENFVCTSDPNPTIFFASDEGSHAVWTKDGQWLEYGVNVAATGYYKVDYRIISGYPNGTTPSLGIQVIADGGCMFPATSVPLTGGTWQTIFSQLIGSSGIYNNRMYLRKGRHVLRFKINCNIGSFSINWIKISYDEALNDNLGQPVSGLIEAESFTDKASGLSVFKYTASPIALYSVGYTKNNDWMEYNVFIPSPGDYKIEYRIASSGTNIKIVLKERIGTAETQLAETGGISTCSYGNWYSVFADVNFITPGPHTLRIYCKSDSGGFGIDWIRLTNTAFQTVPGTFNIKQFSDIDSHARILPVAANDYNGDLRYSIDWLEYNIDVHATGNYNIELIGYGAPVGGLHCDVIEGDSILVSVPIPGSLGSQFTVTGNIILNKGKHTVRVNCKGGKFVLRSICIY